MDRETIANLIDYDEAKEAYRKIYPKEILTFWDACEDAVAVKSLKSIIEVSDQLLTMIDVLNLVIWHRCKELGYLLLGDLESKLHVTVHEDIQLEDYMIDELPEEYWNCLTEAEKEKVIQRSRKQKALILEKPYFWKELSDKQREIIGDFAEKGGIRE